MAAAVELGRHQQVVDVIGIRRDEGGDANDLATGEPSQRMDVVDERLVEDQLSGSTNLVHVAVHAADVMQLARAGQPPSPAARAPGRTRASGRVAAIGAPSRPRHRRFAGTRRLRPPAASRTARVCPARTQPSPTLRGCLPARRSTNPSRSAIAATASASVVGVTADRVARASRAAASRTSATATISTSGNAASERAWNEPIPPAPTIASLIGSHLTDAQVAGSARGCSR